MFLIKARMQVRRLVSATFLYLTFWRMSLQAYSPALPVGTQHHYKSSWHALKTIYQQERFRGLVRGVDAAMLRTSMGSSVGIFQYCSQVYN
jgi:hypothetical protein